MGGGILGAGLFLLDAAVGLVCLVLLLRFYMQAFRVSFANPVGAFVVQFTNVAVKPLRRVLPGFLGLDLASLLPAWLLQVLLVVLTLALRGGLETLPAPQLLGIALWQGALGTLRLSVHLLIGALIVQAVLSWVNPHAPLARPVAELTRPFLQPIRRVVPPVASIDLSPLIAILLAQAVLIFL